jgi:hypothetical protein
VNDSDSLREAIRTTHGCDSRWVTCEAVTETHDGRVVWEGTVEVFDLIGHPTATRCYAWSHEADGDGRRRFYAVLHEPPIDSPRAAVRAAIVADFRAKNPK